MADGPLHWVDDLLYLPKVEESSVLSPQSLALSPAAWDLDSQYSLEFHLSPALPALVAALYLRSSLVIQSSHASCQAPSHIGITLLFLVFLFSNPALDHKPVEGHVPQLDTPPTPSARIATVQSRQQESVVGRGTCWTKPDWMASSEVDQKFLGRLAKAVEQDNPMLSSILFKILGLSLNLAHQLVASKKSRRPDPATSPLFLKRILHIIWLSREGLKMLQEWVIPMVGNHVELKVLAYKLRASFHHIFVLFHNHPPVSNMASWTPEARAAALASAARAEAEERKGETFDGDLLSRPSSVQPTHPLEGGPVGPPPGFEAHVALLPPSFLLPQQDYLPTAHHYFREAVKLADELLWGSHSLRLSVKTEYAAFLYECVHDAEASRKLAKDAIAEAYNATEGVDDDMFCDAAELVTVLGKMMKRGLASSNNTLRSKDQVSSPALLAKPTPPLGMENPI